jgi:hypothetical protein
VSSAPLRRDLHAEGLELASEVLKSSGCVRIRVQGSSMLPNLRPGDEVELRSTPFHAAVIGNVVAYRREGRLFIHRVISRDPQQLITRGDTLSRADVPVTEPEFLGSVSAVFRNGERVEQRNSFGQRLMAKLFRQNRLCAAVFVKCANL